MELVSQQDVCCAVKEGTWRGVLMHITILVQIVVIAYKTALDDEWLLKQNLSVHVPTCHI